jgi:MFS family permease
MASRRSLYGLDWFAFFVADIQTGWGPFVATYLTSLSWTQFDIGLILTIGTITLLALQIPAGTVVDRAPAKRLLAAVAVVSISANSRLLPGVSPNAPAVDDQLVTPPRDLSKPAFVLVRSFPLGGPVRFVRRGIAAAV